MPAGVRRDADPGPARPRGARPADDGRARDPGDRRRHRAAGRLAGRTSACAPPPSATSPTASGRHGRCTTPGSPITLGSDSHAVVDLLEEARAVELDERLATGVRGTWSATELLAAATRDGHASLGFADAGHLSVGARADLVAVRLDSVRTAGGDDADVVQRVVFAGTAADVTDVVASGRRIVEGGEHVLGDVGRLLTEALAPLA